MSKLYTSGRDTSIKVPFQKPVYGWRIYKDRSGEPPPKAIRLRLRKLENG